LAFQIKEELDCIVFDVQVVPRGSRERLAGVVGDRLKVQLTAPPVEGAANEALRTFIAKRLQVPRSRVEILRGQTGRKKTLRVCGIDREKAAPLLEVAS
jgi:uncharacterized protein (TIGR00251 family)